MGTTRMVPLGPLPIAHPASGTETSDPAAITIDEKSIGHAGMRTARRRHCGPGWNRQPVTNCVCRLADSSSRSRSVGEDGSEGPTQKWSNYTRAAVEDLMAIAGRSS